MKFFKKLFSSNIGTVIDKVSNVVDEFHMSGEEKAKFKLEMKSLLYKRASEIDKTIRSEMDAQKEVLVAELTQGDNFTKRARPTVVYAGLGIILLNNILIPLLCKFIGYAEDPFTIPNEFWLGWSGIVATWSIGRTVEKKSNKRRVEMKEYEGSVG